MYTLKITQATQLKQSTNQSIQLKPEDLHTLDPQELAIAAYTLIEGHIKFTLGKDKDGNQIAIGGRNTWYVFAKHAQILKSLGREQQVIAIAPVTQSCPNSYMLMKPTNSRDKFGARLFKLSWVNSGIEQDWVNVVSGAPNLEAVQRSQDFSGSMRPCPEGKFSLGEAEFGHFGNAIGEIWISVNGTEPRASVGMHEDANRYDGFPGSAGCVSPLNSADMRRVAAWRDAGAKTLIVDHGFGTVKY